MKFFLLSILLTSQTFASWDQPQVLCPEEILPRGITCPDLSLVKNIFEDFPFYLSVEEIQEWKTTYASDLKLCRHKEVLRREAQFPGSFTALQQQIAWMVTNGGEDAPEKLAEVLQTSRNYNIPPQILLGAITQESLLASLGISPDGGNYSCGIAQLNLSEWCEAMNTRSLEERTQLGWPAVSCGSLTPALIEPFYNIAVKRLGTRPDYQINSDDFDNISMTDVGMMSEPKFKAASSFIRHCQDISLSIAFKGRTLRNIYDRFVPSAIRQQETYLPGTSFNRFCESRYSSTAYPLQTGWLLAVAMYNAGPRQSKIIEHYYGVQENKFPLMNPVSLIEALHWGGVNKPGTRSVYFTGQDGELRSQPWYKSCVVQRHVARVIQHVTIPGISLARSLEKSACSQEVPAYRKISSGVKVN